MSLFSSSDHWLKYIELKLSSDLLKPYQTLISCENYSGAQCATGN